jgi:hypothetical protein
MYSLGNRAGALEFRQEVWRAAGRKEMGEKTESHMFISLSIIMMYEQTRLITSIGTPEARAKPTIQCSSIQS